MKKLKLEDLQVDSFRTSGPDAERGTVVGQETGGSTCAPAYSCGACETGPICTAYCSLDPECSDDTIASCAATYCGECTNSDVYSCVGC